ncbi:MAG: hypothetical protein KA120_01230 [Candidatus Goldbacteria bacterium]|nr:hypothetical protein [Candidatus Goldiibacteriota bacterium]
MKNLDKDETSINGGDIIDIFGDAGAEKTEVKKGKAGSPAVETKLENNGIESFPEIDGNLIRRDEKSFEKPDFKNENNLAELITLINEKSGVLKKELKKYVSKKLIDNMLLRSLEKWLCKVFCLKIPTGMQKGI